MEESRQVPVFGGALGAPCGSVWGPFHEQCIGVIFVEERRKLPAHGHLHSIHPMAETTYSPIEQVVMSFEYRKAEAQGMHIKREYSFGVRGFHASESE